MGEHRDQVVPRVGYLMQWEKEFTERYQHEQVNFWRMINPKKNAHTVARRVSHGRRGKAESTRSSPTAADAAVTTDRGGTVPIRANLDTVQARTLDCVVRRSCVYISPPSALDTL